MLNDELFDVINKNLPGEVGKVLQERLRKADTDAQKVGELDETLIEHNKQIMELKKQKREMEARDTKQKDLEERDQKLILRESLIDLREKTASERHNDAKEFLRTIFATRAMREQTYGQVPMADNTGFVTQQSTSSGKDTEEDTDPS